MTGSTSVMPYGVWRLACVSTLPKASSSDAGTGAPADIRSRTRDRASRWLESRSALVAITRRSADGEAKTMRASTAAAASASRDAVRVSGAVTSMSGTDDPSPSAGPRRENGANAATNVSSGCRS